MDLAKMTPTTDSRTSTEKRLARARPDPLFRGINPRTKSLKRRQNAFGRVYFGEFLGRRPPLQY